MTTPGKPPPRKKPAKPPTQKRPTKADRADPWDRQPEESDPAWEAFREYRNSGGNRSTAKVAAKLGKSKSLMDRWSSTHNWPIRARSFDNNEDREWLREQAQLRRRAQKRNATTAALTMQKLGEFVMQLDVTKADAGDIAALARVALQAEKDALAIPDHMVIAAGAGSGAVDAATIAGMSDEDRHARLRMLAREVAGRLEDHEDLNDDQDGAA